jgi:hypothetical protein
MKFPAGKYRGRAQAETYRLGQSTQKGTEYSAVEVEITSPEGFAGQTITYTGYWTEKSAQYTAKALSTMGWTGDDPSETPMPGLGSKEVELVIEGEENNGKTYSKIRYVNAAPTELDDQKAKSLAMKFREQIKASRNGSAPPVQDKSAPVKGDKGDDIPF